MPPRIRDALGAAVLALASLVLCAGLLELGLRLFWDDYYLKFRRDLPDLGNRFHPERGWALAPGIRYRHGRVEFTNTHTHNAWGLRGPEIAETKPPGRVRLLALGDSMTYGLGVEDDEAWPAVLQRLAPQLEVINAGVPAYSGVQQLLLLRDEGAALQPDVVLVGVFWNDVHDALHSDYARFTLEEDGALRFHPGEPASPDHPAFAGRRRRSLERAERYDTPIARSYTYRFVSDRIQLLRMQIEEWLEPGLSPRTPPDEDEREPAWALTFALLSEMRRESEAMGARFALTAIPDQVEIEPDVELVGALPVLFETRERVRAFAAREGIPFIDLHPGVRAARARSREPFFHRFDRHWNARGHAAAAAIIADALEAWGWTRPAEPAATARAPAR